MVLNFTFHTNHPVGNLIFNLTLWKKEKLQNVAKSTGKTQKERKIEVECNRTKEV